nr:sulfotransferase [Ruegeria sp. HKCCA6707]
MAVIAFGVAIIRLKVFNLFSSLTSETYSGVSAMFDPSLEEEEKEKRVRRAGLRLLGGAAQIILAFGLALALSYLPLLLADWANLSTIEESLAVLFRLDFLAAITVAALLAAWLFRSSKNSVNDDANAHQSSNDQSINDKTLHTLAFSGASVLRVAGKLDDHFAARKIANVDMAPPIFVTSLARAGTTAVLNALCDLPGSATHLYRDMPFVTAPVIWSRLSAKRAVTRRERAHGDGLEIDLDTPEAFEEVLWKLHWPEKYLEDGIECWGPKSASAAATEDIQRHFKKIIYLRQSQSESGDWRYVSKNNANIARLGLLPKMFPSCKIVVPIRHPAAHCASLMRQHENFKFLHQRDPFVKKYMHDIGHFEFGELHRPLLFEGVDQLERNLSSADYWLSYWLCAFQSIARHADDVIFVTQDDLRTAPKSTMDALVNRVGYADRHDLSGFFRNVPDERPDTLFSKPLLKRATDQYEALSALAIR